MDLPREVMIELKYTHEDGDEIIVKTNEITLPEVIGRFENFLKAIGYVLPKGASLGYEYEFENEEKDE